MSTNIAASVPPIPALHIDGERLLARLDALAEVGAISGGGVCRLAFSEADAAGRALVVAWMQELGLEVRLDPLGNTVGRLAGREPELPAVMTGSHIDTVRTGGRYDGNLGVLAGLEAVAVLRERGITPRRSLEVAYFSNEEGARFPPDMMGSLVYVGDLALDEARASRDANGVCVGDAAAAIGVVGDAPLPGPTPHAFVELHIEQGPVLDLEGHDLGVVSAVQGISWQRFTFRGVSNHAGTCPMHLRHDAGYVAGRVMCEVRALPPRYLGAMVATVGFARFSPNLVNVVPNEVAITVDLRNVDPQALAQAERDLDAFIDAACAEEGVEVSRERLARFSPHSFDTALQDLIRRQAEALGLSSRAIVSGAGHDAQILGRVCPAAMIFVPSVGGISHNVAEHTEPRHLIAGATVLLRTLVSLAG